MEDNKSPKINWLLFPHGLIESVMKGQEKQLSAEEIREANELIKRMHYDKLRLSQIFDAARTRYAAQEDRI